MLLTGRKIHLKEETQSTNILAPVNPEKLLKTLEIFLSPEGGILDLDKVPKVACIMKRFSKKLVSRSVYCNILQATRPELLSGFLDEGGWETINTWLQNAKTSSSNGFLIELLKLCKMLPMTLKRLQENNTAKIIKSLTKHDNSDVRDLSSDLVNQWIAIIKVKKAIETTVDRKKRKEKITKPEKVVPSEDVKVSYTSEAVPENLKAPVKLKGHKRTLTERDGKNVEICEDLKIDSEPLLPVPKKSLSDRPETVKKNKKKFKATGLEEKTPLPKTKSKKISTVDKTAVAAAARNVVKMSSSTERIIEKKKPESLMTINETLNTKGIELIPAQPQSTFLQEGESLRNAMISQPVDIVERKMKVPVIIHPFNRPLYSLQTISHPKLQFYKDTLKMNEEAKEKEPEKANSKVPNEEHPEHLDSSNMEESTPMDTTENEGNTPPNGDSVDINSPSDSVESQKEVEPRQPFDPNNLRSILCLVRKRSKSKIKTVKWVDDSNIEEVFYFEMDDMERGNVSKSSNFYDLKSIEMKREGKAMEMAKRQMGNKVEELIEWWSVPIIVDCPPPPAVPGCNSSEKTSEMLRQQSTLQEVYFTREMIPDSPYEPDLEIFPAREPKVIPFDEDNTISAVNDYSNYTIVKPPLPDILSALMKINTAQSPTQTENPESMQVTLDSQIPNQPLPNPEPMVLPHLSMPHSQPYEPVLVSEPISGLLDHMPPPPFSTHPPPESHDMKLQGGGQAPQEPSPTVQYYVSYAMNENIPPNQYQPPIRRSTMPQGNIRPNFRGGSRGKISEPISGLLDHMPPPHFSTHPPPESHDMKLEGGGQTPQEPAATVQYYVSYAMNQNIPPNQYQPPIRRNTMPQGNIRPNFRGGSRGKISEPISGLLDHMPPPHFSTHPPPESHDMKLEGGGQTPQEPSPTVQYYVSYAMNENIPPNQYQPPIRRSTMPQGNIRPNFRDGFRGKRNRRPPKRKICRHFTKGHCKYGMDCAFLHPGVNGPPF